MRSPHPPPPQVLVALRHPNIVSLYGVILDPPSLVMEFLHRGSLYAALHDDTLPLSRELSLRFASDVARALAFVHARRLVHRDVKSLNVLLDALMAAKLSDFGAARAADVLTSVGGGTILWMAPEALADARGTCAAADVYSLGVVMWEIATRETPYATNADAPSGHARFVEFVMGGGRPELGGLEEGGWGALGALIARCWGGDPSGRPEAAEVLAALEAMGRAGDGGGGDGRGDEAVGDERGDEEGGMEGDSASLLLS
jgi:serine/threonine protein kinase